MNQNEQQNGLLACPFCGGAASLALCGFGTAKATCMDCGSEGSYSPSREEAIAAWNRRGLSSSASEPVGEPTDEALADLSLQFVRVEPLSDFDYVGFAREVLARYASPLPQEPTDAAMLWLCQVRDDFRRMAEDANRVLAQRCAELAVLPQEPREAELTDERIDALIDRVEERVGMAHGAWDMVNPRELVRAVERELRGAQEVKAGEDWQDIPDAVIAGILRFAWKREPTLREITSAAKAAHPSDSRGEKG